MRYVIGRTKAKGANLLTTERGAIMRIRYILVSVSSGILFSILDALINANPLAQKLYTVFEPIARKSINIPVGIAIDILYGFAMSGIFLMLYRSLPGQSSLAKGMSFGSLAWFFRVVMQAASQWMMYSVPANTLLYLLVCGFIEMQIIGLFYGLALKIESGTDQQKFLKK